MSEALLEYAELPANAGGIGRGELRAFLGLKPSRSASKKLPSEVKALFTRIFEASNGLLEHVVNAGSEDEFKERRDAAIKKYVHVQNALIQLAKGIIPPALLQTVSDAALSNLDSEIADKALHRFGGQVGDQARFTTWSIQRTLTILDRIEIAGDVAEGDVERDKELANECSFWLWWSLFHMDCLRAALRLERPLRPGVIEAIVDGLRSAVNAHVVARESLALRPNVLVSQPAVVPTEWDEEDQDLLDSSMADFDKEPAAQQDEY